MAQGLLNRLEREGFVSSARGRRVTRMVLKEKLAQGMERFMLRKAKAAGLEDMGQGDKREVEEKASGPHFTLLSLGNDWWCSPCPPPVCCLQGPSVEQITQVASSLSLEGRGQPRAKVGGVRLEGCGDRSDAVSLPLLSPPLPSPKGAGDGGGTQHKEVSPTGQTC